MLHRIIFSFTHIVLLFFSTVSFADQITCPSVNDIKNHNFNFWLPLYKEGEELASAHDVDQFRAHITEFVVAKWGKVYLENGHCFYKGDDPILEKIVFAQDAWRPVKNSHWTWINANALAVCDSTNVAECGFIT